MTPFAERIVSPDGSTIKYIHLDRSETTVKFGSQCGQEVSAHGIEMNRLDEHPTEKMTIFVSSSVGCQLQCKMCYLTAKNFPYEPLGGDQIVSNVIDVIEDVKVSGPLKPIKLSLMGMGEALLNSDMSDACYAIEEYIDCLEVPLIGVDLGTCMPTAALSHAVDRFPYMVDAPIRLFYSLHTPLNDVRKVMMPGTANLDDAFETLREMREEFNWDFDIIFHYTPVDGVNDSGLDALQLARLLREEMFSREQVRLLRFNECPGSIYSKTKRFDAFAKELAGYRGNVRYQISTGSEIKAACGQFIARETMSAT